MTPRTTPHHTNTQAQRQTMSLALHWLALTASISVVGLGAAAARAAEPAPATTPLARSYGEHCAHCHSGGAPSAPRLGDAQAWRLRTAAGLNTLYRSAIEGIPNTAMFA